MDVILHLGAHRTGTSTFQDYMRRHADEFAAQQVGFWGPGRTRRGLFSCIMPGPEAARGRDLRARGEGRVRLQLDAAQARGLKTVLISDENMIGTIRDNLRHGMLYPGIGERMARFARAFDGRIRTVLICPRSLELYWCSAISFGVDRGHPVPTREKLRTIAHATRGWRDVITDLACALPGVEFKVIPFESVAGQPDCLLALGTDLRAPKDSQRQWLNRAPTLPELRRALAARGGEAQRLPFGMGRWNPFSNEEHAALREIYADDMMWLTAGADGLATLTENRNRTRVGITPPPVACEKGQTDDIEERQMARPG